MEEDTSAAGDFVAGLIMLFGSIGALFLLVFAIGIVVAAL